MAGPSVVTEEPWMALGACKGAAPDLFFPTKGESLKPAREICRGCVVQEDCLDYAIDNNIDHGIWGGASERQRRRIRRGRILRGT